MLLLPKQQTVLTWTSSEKKFFSEVGGCEYRSVLINDSGLYTCYAEYKWKE
jgi:hypothetical protein